MWKRIHSNRDPRDTLYSEIRKEFSSYFAIASGGFKKVVEAYPKIAYSLMIALLISSAALSFTVFRHPDKSRPVETKTVNPIGDGFDQILNTAGKIRVTMRLKKRVDSITAKTKLTTTDSSALESALDSLQTIQH